jgi:hypothetical protein
MIKYICNYLVGGIPMEMQDKKKYKPPEIIFETELEVKAGSPLGSAPDAGVDLFPGSPNE